MKRKLWGITAGFAVGALLVYVLSVYQRPAGDRAKLDKINAMYREYHTSFSEVPVLTVPELLELQKREKVTLVDVREDAERRVATIPNAVSVDEFERGLERYRDGVIVTYCTIGYRSGLYAKGLLSKNLRVYNLQGSILSWVHAGQRVVNENGPTRRLHVYGRKWNLVPKGYEGVW